MSFVCAFIRQGWTYFLLNYYIMHVLFNTPEKLEQALAQFLSVCNGQGHVFVRFPEENGCTNFDETFFLFSIRA